MAEAKLIDGKARGGGAAAPCRRGRRPSDRPRRPMPGLATVLVGADPASEVYVRSKVRLAGELGMASFDFKARRDDDGNRAAGGDRRAQCRRAGARHPAVQLPLPAHIDTTRSSWRSTRPRTSTAFTFNVGRLGTVARRAARLPGAVHAARRVDAAAGHAGRSGRPQRRGHRSVEPGRPSVAQLLLRADCTVTIAHSRTGRSGRAGAARRTSRRRGDRPARIRAATGSSPAPR